MNKVAQRLLVFFIGIPIVLGIVLLDFYNYLPLNLILVICSATAAAELYKLFSAKTELLPKFLVCTLSALLPLLSYLLVFLKKDIDYSNWAFLVAAMILMAAEVFTHKTFETSNVRIVSSIFIVFYSGFLFTFITRMTIQENATVLICVFLFTVFITDSLAWLFGVLLGKNNRGICRWLHRCYCNLYSGTVFMAGCFFRLLRKGTGSGHFVCGKRNYWRFNRISFQALGRNKGQRFCHSGTRRLIGFNRLDFVYCTNILRSSLFSFLISKTTGLL